MAVCLVSLSVTLLVLCASGLVAAVASPKQTDYSSQIADLKTEFQTKMDYLFQVIREKDHIHANEIARLKRHVDILQAQCCSNNLAQDSSLTEPKRNTTVVGIDDSVTSSQTVRGSKERHQENLSQSRDRRSSLAYQRTARVGQVYRKHVAFYSYLTNRLTNLRNNQPIMFNHVVTNLANPYDASSGMFHCGVPGVYVFNVHLLSLPGKDINTVLLKNGAMVSAIYAGGRGGTYDHGGNTAVLELAVGDQVWVRIASGTEPGATLDYNYSSFSGFLLYPY